MNISVKIEVFKEGDINYARKSFSRRKPYLCQVSRMKDQIYWNE